MKNFSPDGPEHGLFELSLRSPAMEPVFSRHAAAVARPAPFGVNGNTASGRGVVRGGFYRRFAKRGFDLLLLAFGLPLALPIIGFCALALWIEGGSPFYTQKRIGRGGKQFSIVKLRSMVRDADAVLEDYLARDPHMRREWDTLQKLKSDPRVTRVGRLLRATSIDELPQLFNVLSGDMSIVGPRPMMPEQAALYGNARAYEALRPGITGLWQISTRNNSHFSYRNEVDAAYERALTFRADLSILIRTVGVVLRGTGC